MTDAKVKALVEVLTEAAERLHLLALAEGGDTLMWRVNMRIFDEARAAIAALEQSDAVMGEEQERCDFCNYPLPAHSDICIAWHAQRNPAPCAEPPLGPSPGYREVVIDRNASAETVEQIISAWAFAHDIDGAARNDLFARLRSTPTAPVQDDDAEVTRLRKELSRATGRQRVSIVDQEGKEIGHYFASMKELLTDEAFVDENGTAWTRPTGWAYFAACRARDASRLSPSTEEGVPRSALPVFERVTRLAHTLSCDVPITAEARKHIDRAYEMLAALAGKSGGGVP